MFTDRITEETIALPLTLKNFTLALRQFICTGEYPFIGKYICFNEVDITWLFSLCTPEPISDATLVEPDQLVVITTKSPSLTRQIHI
ncbi:MAG: hypothetical protein AAB546_03980 [Patescibacteria group bacterium]